MTKYASLQGLEFHDHSNDIKDLEKCDSDLAKSLLEQYRDKGYMSPTQLDTWNTYYRPIIGLEPPLLINSKIITF